MAANVGNGWTYLVLEGDPDVRGRTHGEALGYEILGALGRADFMCQQDTGERLQYFADAVSTTFDDFRDHISTEIRAELQGIADGASKKTGTPVTLQQIIAHNAYEELVGSWWPWKQAHPTSGARRWTGARPRCSAFIATGKNTTTNGKIVAAHNSWDRYTTGGSFNVVLDVRPPKGNGQRVLMQAAPGWVTSNADWMITDAGLIVVETTIGSFDGAFDEGGDPEFYRSRNATQYATSIEKWIELFSTNNNAGYVNTWMLGGTYHGVENTIALYELGTGADSAWFTSTTDGFYTGYNVANSPKIRMQQCTEPGQRFDIRGNAARRVRLETLLSHYKGKIDGKAAQSIIGDHHDAYLGEDNHPGSRSICGHLDLDDGKWGNHGQPPFFPWGANDGKVFHAGEDPKNLEFWARWGNSCGLTFKPDEFIRDHPQYAEFKDHLDERTGYDWTQMPPHT